MIRNAAAIFSGNLVGSLTVFLRNIFLARLLSLEDYGIAMTFAVVVTAMELASYMATDRQLIQAKDGDDPRLQQVMHGAEIMRGLVVGIVLYFIAAPIALFFHAEEATPAFQMLAIVPVMRSFRHLDLFRRQRHRDFRSLVLSPMISQVAATVAIFPLVWFFGDYRAMLGSVIVQNFTWVALSHYFAERRYSFGWDFAIIKRILNFGWPLFLNTVLIFLITNGDRLIVGNQYGLTVLGWFSAAFSVVLTATGLMRHTLETLFLPSLSGRIHSGGDEQEMLWPALQGFLFAGTLFAVGTAILGPWLFLLVFGAKFQEAVGILVFLGIMFGIRIGRSGPNTAAIAYAQTTNPMWSNLLRIVFIVAAYGVALLGVDVMVLLQIGIVGETLSYLLSLYLLGRRTGHGYRPMVLPGIVAAGVFVGIGAFTLLTPQPMSFRATFSVESLVLLLGLVAVAATMRPLLSFARTMISSRLRSTGKPSAP